MRTFIFFIFKKNKSLKFCINYQNLNIVTIKNQYLLLLIDEMLNQLMNVQIFFKIDLQNAYHQIHIAEKDE